MRGATPAGNGTAVVLDTRNQHWSARGGALVELAHRGARIWLLTRTGGGRPRGLAVRELTEVRGFAPRTGGSGPVAGGAWGVAGGRIGLPEQEPGGAPAPGVGGTPGMGEVGGASWRQGLAGPRRSPGPAGPRAGSVVAAAASWRLDGHVVRFARLRGAAAALDTLPHLLVQERRQCPSGAEDVLALTTDTALAQGAAQGVATTTLGLDPRTHDAVWVYLQGNEPQIADALARRAVLLVDDDRGALVAVGPPVLVEYGDLAVGPPAWGGLDLTHDTRDLAG